MIDRQRPERGHPDLPNWANGTLIAVGVAGAALATILDVLTMASYTHLLILGATGAVMAIAVLIALWEPVAGAVVGMAAVIGGSTVAAVGLGYSHTPGALESFLLMVLAFLVTQRSKPVAAALTLAGLVVSGVWSWGVAVQSFGVVAFAPLPVLFAAGVAGLARLTVWQRDRDVVDVRNVEQIDLARELHDVIAHHMTGIVIQAQAGQMVARTDPDKTVEVLNNIEQAGAGALAAMRQLVSNLRGGDTLVPTTDAAGEIRVMVDSLGIGGASVHVHIDDFPAELGPTLVRLTREALTNVARHAVGVSRIEVDVSDDGPVLRWSVRDDGTPPVQPASADSGFGLIGMRERVETLGGAFKAGFDSSGWVVEATIPKAGHV